MKSLAAILVLLLASLASARIKYFSLIEMAQESDITFTGEVQKIDKDTATIQIDKVLQGSFEGKTILVSPITLHTDMGELPNIKAGESVLIFAKRAQDHVSVVALGQGKLTLDPATRADQVAAVARLIQVAAMKDQDAMNVAMLADATSPNLMLRAIAQRFITSNLGDRTFHDKYKSQLVALLFNDDPGNQRTALDAVRFADVADALPRIIELSRSADPGVVSSASLTLARYDTREAADALIALTRHPNPQVRQRAAIDLSHIHFPEAKAAVAVLIDDPDATVRAIAPVGLIELLRAGKADDLLPRIAALLNDPDDQVRVRAASTMGETRNTQAISPLLDVLQREGISRDLEYFTLDALYAHYSKDGPQAKQLVDQHVDLIIASLKKDTAPRGNGPAFHAMGILLMCPLPEAREAVVWAAQSHPNQEVRDYAKRGH